MHKDRFHNWIRAQVKTLQKFADRKWYPAFIGFLAGLDNFVVIIPNDGLLISSSMLKPKRWLSLAFWVALGSTLGAIGLAALVEYKGLPWILDYYPGINATAVWRWTEEFFHANGLLVVFVVAATPLMQHPAVILAALANTPLAELALTVFVGRFLKFLAMAYVGSHAPRFLGRLWGVQGELKELGIEAEAVPEPYRKAE